MSPGLPFSQFCSFYLSKRKAGSIWLTEKYGRKPELSEVRRPTGFWLLTPPGDTGSARFRVREESLKKPVF